MASVSPLFLSQAKEEFNKIQLELAGLSTKFSNNVLDATKAFSLTLEDKAEVEGLPASALGLAAQSAKVLNACCCTCTIHVFFFAVYGLVAFCLRMRCAELVCVRVLYICVFCVL